MVQFDFSKFVKDLDTEKVANIVLTPKNGENYAQIIVDNCGEFYKIQYSKVIDGKYIYHVLDVQKTMYETICFIRGFIAAVNYM